MNTCAWNTNCSGLGACHGTLPCKRRRGLRWHKNDTVQRNHNQTMTMMTKRTYSENIHICILKRKSDPEKQRKSRHHNYGRQQETTRVNWTKKPNGFRSIWTTVNARCMNLALSCNLDALNSHRKPSRKAVDKSDGWRVVSHPRKANNDCPV